MGHAWVTKDMMNAVGREWATPRYRRYDECSGYGMGHALVTEALMNVVGTEWVTHEIPRF